MPPNKIPSLVYFAINDWLSIKQREQHLCEKFCQGRRVLYVERPKSLARFIINLLKPGKRIRLRGWLKQVSPNLWVYRPPCLLPFELKYSWCLKFNNFAVGIFLERLLERLEFNNKIIGTGNPVWSTLLLKLKASLKYYDCMDNYSGFASRKISGELLDNAERRLLKQVDCVFVTADKLAEKFSDFGGRIEVIRNGVNVEDFKVNESTGGEPRFARPNLGYVGMLSSWFDGQAIARLSEEVKELTIVLVGPMEGDIECGSLLRDAPNVHFVGPVPYKDVPQILQTFDLVCIPFKRNALTTCVNPTKIYEYFAAGKTVIAAQLPELKQFGELLFLYRTPEEFLSRVNEALQVGGKKDPAKLKAIAEANSWQSRADKMGAVWADLEGR